MYSCDDDTSINPLHNVLSTTTDIEMGGQCTDDFLAYNDMECTICLGDIIPIPNSPYGCGNTRCSARFCDDCIGGLSERHIYTTQCCTCTEPCGDVYTDRLDRLAAIVFVYDGNHYFIVSPFPLIHPYQIKLITTPIIESNLDTFRTAYIRSTNISTNTSSTVADIFSKNINRIQWFDDTANVRWGKLIHTRHHYTTDHYQIIYTTNATIVVLMSGLFVMYGGELSDLNFEIVSAMITFVNAVSIIMTYWLFILQILYIDVGVISANMIRFRTLVFGGLNCGIIANNVFMLEDPFGDSVDVYVILYTVNIIIHAITAMWIRCFVIPESS